MASYNSLDVQYGSRGLICLDIITTAKIQQFKIYVGKNENDVKVTPLGSRPFVSRKTEFLPRLPVDEKGSFHVLPTNQREQGRVDSRKRCPLQGTPPLSDEDRSLPGSGEGAPEEECYPEDFFNLQGK
ncbi:MAG: hypothetical protein K6C34_03255 [Alphaproteobacteria bacterium]|nr:hypothetical protein [Alphaproteobacteria bacterium]